MRLDAATAWGPPPLLQDLQDQLRLHGLETSDAALCVARLETNQGPAARASLFVDLGSCRLFAGDEAGALACWRHAAVSGQPVPAAQALYNLGRFRASVGLVELARMSLEAAAADDLEPVGSHAKLAMARLAADQDDLDTAMHDLASLADALLHREVDGGLLTETMLGLGDTAERLGLLERAAEAYDTARSAAPESDRPATAALVRVLQRQGDHERAARVAVGFDGVLDVTPVLDRVERLIRSGQDESAADTLGHLAGVDCRVEDRFRRVSAMVAVGLANEAIDELDELNAAPQAETRDRAGYLLAEVYLAHDHTEVAVPLLEAVDRSGRGAWADRARLALGDVADAAGDHSAARGHWSRAVDSTSAHVSAAAERRLAAEAGEAPVDGSVTIATEVSVADEQPDDRTIVDPLDAPIDEDHGAERPGAFAVAVERSEAGVDEQPDLAEDLLRNADGDARIFGEGEGDAADPAPVPAAPAEPARIITLEDVRRRREPTTATTAYDGTEPASGGSNDAPPAEPPEPPSEAVAESAAPDAPAEVEPRVIPLRRRTPDEPRVVSLERPTSPRSSSSGDDDQDRPNDSFSKFT